MTDDKLHALETGRIHWFSDWPTGDVPRKGAIVYTVWDRSDRFIYVGHSGRKGASHTGKGPFGRLSDHANGNRSGDKVCIYICDKYVLPKVKNRIQEIAAGDLSLDKLTKEFVRKELGFRFQKAADDKAAREIEDQILDGALQSGKPILNRVILKARASSRNAP